MRCAGVEGLIEAYIDGGLDAARKRAVELHLEACARCRARVEAARSVTIALAKPAGARAPAGFAARVMNAVYREALAGVPGAAAAETGVYRARISPRGLRRLGLSFVFTAAVLSVSLFIPAAAYPRLIGPESAAAGAAAGGPSLVKNAIAGAGRMVRGALQAETDGGTTR